MHLLDYFNPDGPPTALFEIGTPCATCEGTGVQKDDRNCDCLVPHIDGAGQHSPGCACLKPCPCAPASSRAQSPLASGQKHAPERER